MSPELELHVVGLYEGKASPEIDGLGAKVHVTMTHAPLILCLTSYEPVTWMLEVDDRVDLRQVILGGQNGSVTRFARGNSGRRLFPAERNWKTYLLCVQEERRGQRVGSL